MTGTILNTITDNALTSLTINNVDTKGAAVSIIDNLTTPTPTTLTLNLLADGIDNTGFAPAAAFPASSLILVDAKNEISTIHLSLGNQNSVLQLLDNGLTTLDTPTAGTGALVGNAAGTLASSITDNGGAAKFDFSGLNGPNNIDVDRVSGAVTDIYTLGNFGTNAVGATPFSTAQHLVIENTNTNNGGTINFGSGAYDITDSPHAATNSPHTYVNTAPNGAGLIAGFTPGTLEPWAEITNAHAAAVGGDNLMFKNAITNTFNLGAQASVGAGITAAIAANGGQANTAGVFWVGTNGYVFDHSVTSTGPNISPTDSLVEFVGIAAPTFTGSTLNGGVHLAT